MGEGAPPPGGSHHELTPAMQDYLKAIHGLSERGLALTNGAVAEALDLSAASVSAMVRKLAKRGLLTHTPYRQLELTDEGRTVALELVRHHRIIELFLVKVLGMRWDEVHDEAERLEHVISERLEQLMAEAMGDPLFDPHGHPIPRPCGGVKAWPELMALSEAAPGAALMIREVCDRDPEVLRYMGEQGLRPGTLIHLERRHPFEGPIELRVAGRVVVLSRQLAGLLQVTPVTD